MSAFLSDDWAGGVIAVVVILAGLGIMRARRAALVRYLGISVLVLGASMAVGSIVHMVSVAGFQRQFPPPGKLVDVGGYRVHVLAEGQNKGNPTVVFIPGAHSPGYALYHLHRALRQETRSILFDRGGSGWSDPGPFPRRTLQEVEELRKALQAAGERGPYVLVGHSYGGLLAVNYAFRHPEDVAGLVLLDATHPDYFVYSPADWVSATISVTRLSGVAQLFGIDLTTLIHGKDFLKSDVYRAIAQQLGDVWGVYLALETQPDASFATASLFTEIQTLPLTPILVRDGDLGDLPIGLAFGSGPTCGGDVHVPCPAIFAPILKQFIASTGLTERDFRRQNDMMGIISKKYSRLSSDTFTRFAPPGSSHNFPYEAPEFTVGVIREELARIAAARGAAEAGR
jgi:pimeloyl-ACP methyl ester carboxylesterase